MRHRSLLSALAALLVVVLVLENSGPFLTSQLTTMAYFAVAAGGLTVLTGLNGQLSLGHGALMAVGAYSTALLLRSEFLPLPVILVLAMVITLAVGALVGVAAARLHGPYLAGATLALAVAVPGIPLFFGEALGGEQGLPVRMPEIPVWLADAAYFVTGHELTSIRYLAYLSWFAVIIVFVLLANLSRGRVGRDWRAVRDEDVAAELTGIDLGRTRVRAFVVSSGCAGLAGALMALSARLAAPSGFALTLSLLLVSAVVLGGLGSLTGALAGAALLTFLPPLVTGAGTDLGLSDVQAAHLAPLIYGLVTVLIVLLAPAGLAGGLRKLIHRRRTS
ncbi:amino acid/amide ABC transporter membrane protein 2, HAAT family [Amycolatopsis lurida]|uniref:Branched-chain amino acid ABC transporter permease n=1 Tax=Amycolatopsis lurida NRRL 2430 TaxID=1460371 RepID=A0A2P2FNW9_AMYLU|nr:branched-chain amino acid ABC transporter permease [Amycolatopsis lurida]KFU78396.1 branched-chain amino acid ABC transporter permease [Amycolatopsis lurida NRRL 2430]SEE58167.1 amino acid/amide ABC transporter membrane protein 2, HAAT family [Amycolatopsis lurida]